MRTTNSLTLFTILSASFACSQCGMTDAPVETAEPTGESPRVRLGTWNLEHFGSRNPARTDADIEKIARFIVELRVDVLAVQEINGPKPLARLMAHLGDDYRFCLGTTGGFRRTFISVGFIWNRKRIELVQCEEMRDFPSRKDGLPIFHRKPVNAVFRARSGGLDFRAITVHLKASRGKQNEAKRRAEATVLHDYILKLYSDPDEDRDIVVIGDFNHTYNAPAHAAFRAGEVVHYLGKRTTPTIIWFDDPIDQIAVAAGFREEIVDNSFQVHNGTVDYRNPALTKEQLEAAEKNFQASYSDHFPVTVDLDAARDRDPDATFAAPKHELPVRAKE